MPAPPQGTIFYRESMGLLAWVPAIGGVYAASSGAQAGFCALPKTDFLDYNRQKIEIIVFPCPSCLGHGKFATLQSVEPVSLLERTSQYGRF